VTGHAVTVYCSLGFGIPEPYPYRAVLHVPVPIKPVAVTLDFEQGPHFYPIEFFKTLRGGLREARAGSRKWSQRPYRVRTLYEADNLSTTSCSALIKMTPFCSGFSTSPSHPPHPINSLYFMTAADACVLIAFRDNCLALLG
jgi:hypothetical protein